MFFGGTKNVAPNKTNDQTLFNKFFIVLIAMLHTLLNGLRVYWYAITIMLCALTLGLLKSCKTTLIIITNKYLIAIVIVNDQMRQIQSNLKLSLLTTASVVNTHDVVYALVIGGIKKYSC